MSDMDKLFHEWRKEKGRIGVHSLAEVDEFLAERKAREQSKPEVVRAEVAKWLKQNPDYFQCESNREQITDFLKTRDLPFTVANLDRALVYMKNAGVVIQRPPEPVVDQDKPETRGGVWKNGEFTPFDTGSGRGYVKKYGIGQNAPGVSAEDDAVIRKRAESMTSAEFEKACRTSKEFRDKYDKV